MINDVLTKIKDNLNDYLKSIASLGTNQVSYPDGKKLDPLIFPENNVVPILVNIEEEKMIRQANNYAGVITNGIKTELNPAIGINMLVLFVSSFSDYEQSLQFISLIISYFQKFPFFDHYNMPSLPDSVEKVTVELITLPIAQRNELWSSLKVTYRPSVLYKIGVLIYNDDTPAVAEQIINDVQLNTVSILK